ncbi:MAG: hypothetical protein M3Z84_05620 [Actinomycetota bacterium]|nr:hypothetical protein [Actinomycetota bacterium]
MPVVAFLGLLWAAVLIPVTYKAVAARRARFASSFGHGLQALEQAEGFFGPPDDRRAETPLPEPALNELIPVSSVRGIANAALLRSILAGLLIAVVLSLLVAVVTGQRAMFAVNLALDDCLLAFVALIVRRRDTLARSRRPVEPVAPEAVPIEIDPPAPRRVYTAGVPVIAAPVAGALTASVASTG